MKKWVLITKSESSDNYIYFINHPTKPTTENIKDFLKVNANDKEENDDDEDGAKVFEYQELLKEIIENKFLTIPK